MSADVIERVVLIKTAMTWEIRWGPVAHPKGGALLESRAMPIVAIPCVSPTDVAD